jgi:hypothetical protein
MRVVRPLLITLAVLAVLFVIADRIAVALAESEAADQLRQSRQTDGKPEVSIDGFPFLTQLLGGELDKVHASAEGMRAEDTEGTSLRITKFSADLHDVKFSDGFATATARGASGTVRISYADLSAAAPPGVRISYGGPSSKAGVSEVKASAGIPVLGEQSVTSEISLVDGDTVRVRAKSVPASSIPGAEERIREYLDFDKQVTGLPEGMRLDSIEADESGIVIELSGKDVSLTR